MPMLMKQTNTPLHTRNRRMFILESNMNDYGLRTQIQVTPHLKASIAVITHFDQKHLEGQRVNFTLQLVVHQQRSQRKKSRQDPGGRR